MLEYKPYHHLKSFKQATIIYDFTPLDKNLTSRLFNSSYHLTGFTVEFTAKYIKSYRTKEQMDHAARSGKQNIAEGSELGKTSKKSEIKLLGVSRASLKELCEDYQDYLRQNKLELWTKNHPESIKIRNLVYSSLSYSSYSSYLTSAEPAANAIICLINQTTYLLDHQIAKVERDFFEQGGYTENLYQQRTEYRSNNQLGKK